MKTLQQKTGLSAWLVDLSVAEEFWQEQVSVVGKTCPHGGFYAGKNLPGDLSECLQID
ncbi:MAG: hypothetical protein AAB316_06375 [Bacteroidota bacterium]